MLINDAAIKERVVVGRPAWVCYRSGQDGRTAAKLYSGWFALVCLSSSHLFLIGAREAGRGGTQTQLDSPGADL